MLQKIKFHQVKISGTATDYQFIYLFFICIIVIKLFIKNKCINCQYKNVLYTKYAADQMSSINN